MGPDIAIGKVMPWGVYGAKAKHVTGVMGDNTWNTNITTLEVFFAYGLKNGWQLLSSPEIRFDWEALSDNQWSVPLGGGLSKTMKIGRMPLKLGFEMQYYLISPDSIAPQWLLTFNLTPVIGNPFQK